MIKKKIKMDLSISNAPQIVYAVQGDTNTRNVVIDLYNAGSAWTVPDGASGVVKFQKADGKGGIYDKLPNGFPAVVYEENSNQIEVSLAPQVLTCPGEVKAQVSLIYDNNIISTFSFVVLVQADPSANSEKSTDYVNWDRYFIPQTSGATVGQYLKITKVDSLGRVIEVSPVDAPKNPGEMDTDLDMKSNSIHGVGSLELWNEDDISTVILQAGFPEGDSESENFNGVIEFRTSRGDEPVVIRNIAGANNPNEAVNKKQLDEVVSNVKSAIMSKSLRFAIYNLLMDAVYKSENHESDKDALAELLNDGGNDDDTVATLIEISATYSGGDVLAGTPVSDLSGIIVTAYYSDGTSEAVTDYILSGTIVEGENTITVSYGGKTTTFTVVGIMESGGEDEAEPLYTFETALNVPLPDRYGTKPIEYSVSNGNHVEIKAGDDVSGSAYIRSNFSTAATNGADISNAPEWFKIPANSDVTFKLTNVNISGVPLHEVPTNMKFGLRDMKATQSDEFIVFVKSSENIIPGVEYILNDPWEATVTIESEVSVQGVCAFFVIAAGLSIEFNVELYVNGERWI